MKVNIGTKETISEEDFVKAFMAIQEYNEFIQKEIFDHER